MQLVDSQTILKIVAIVPSLIIFRYVYVRDRLEKEPIRLLIKIFVFGMISVIPTVILEGAGLKVLGMNVEEGTIEYSLAMNFIVIGISEELCKYAAMNIGSWKSPDFNCSYDGVVYGVCAALGFATVENLMYVLPNGIGTGIVRGIISVPAHACFGVFQGAFYGLSKKWSLMGNSGKSIFHRILGLVIPILFHGLFDFCLTEGTDTLMVVYFIFVPVMFITTLILINKLSKKDHPITGLYTDNI